VRTLAETTKKKTTTASKSTGKTASGKSSSTAKSAPAKSGGRKPPARKPAAKQPRVRREVWAGVLLFFSFVAFLSAFHVDGFFINWYTWLVGTLIGCGLHIMPYALLISGVLLLVKRKGKARLRVSCIMLLPVFFGSIRHLLLTTGGFESLKLLAQSGRALESGGLLSGGLALLLRAALSNVGAVILLMVLFAVAVIIACNLSFTRIKARVADLRPLPEPEEEEEMSAVAVPVRTPAPQSAAKGRRAIDINIEENDVSKRTPDRNVKTVIAPPNVPTPAEVLRGIEQQEKAAAQTAPQPEAAPEPAAEPIPVKDPAAPVQPQYETSQAELRMPEPEPQPAPEEAFDEVPVEQQIQNALDNRQEPVYLYPPLTLLKKGSGKAEGMEEATARCAERLVDTLQSFGVESTVIDITCGPTVTRYELQLQRGIKFSKVTGLSDDIALALGAVAVRIAPIPDKNAIGIEVPNEKQELVTVRDILSSPEFKNSRSKLSFAVGKGIVGNSVVGDIAKMPHMLIAGTTGSGKSVCINSILISLLYKSTPDEVRLIMVDPKMIELGVYNGIPHLLIPVVTDPRKAAGALNWAVTEMMKRYKLFSELGVRDLAGYNQAVQELEGEEGKPLPRIVVVIDELADLMVVARKEVEEAIIRIAQMARAAGMHLIIATQRPSADVITGLMKTNIPSRIAFAVASQVDSRVILDQMGAEKLLGKGDMLYHPLGSGKSQRVQGCFVSDSEVEEVICFIKQTTGQAEYSEEVMNHIEKQAEAQSSGGTGGGMPSGDGGDEDDELLPAAIEVVVESGMASVSMLQRRLKLGYARAARLVDQMEERGIVGPFEGSKPRAVLISKDDWKEMVLRRDNLM